MAETTLNTSVNQGKTRGWPEPLVLPPVASHTHTAILLHGRGSNALRFGPEFLNSKTSGGKTLPELFPGMRFIFPTAKKRRSTALNRMPISHWFDNASLDDPSQREDLQIEGLRETAAFLRPIIEVEAGVVGPGNVIIGGLSQGCAAALHVLLSFPADEGPEQRPLGGFIGMSGWLPFRDRLDDILHPSVEYDQGDDPFSRGDDDDPFSQEDDTEEQQSVEIQAVNLVRDNLTLPPTKSASPICFRTPIFLGHGKDDEKVPRNLGRQIAEVLEALHMDVTWKRYECGHWYKVPDEIDDIVSFLYEKAGLLRE